MKTKLTNEMCFETQNGTPDDLAMYADDVTGTGAIAQAVKDLLAGKTVTFASCTRDGAAPPMINDIITFAPMPGSACVRICGERDKPDSASSSTLHGCGSIYAKGTIADLDPIRIAASMTYALFSAGKRVFRLKDVEVKS